MILKGDRRPFLILAMGCILLLMFLQLFALARPTKPTIVYISVRRGEENWSIYTMDLDGRNIRRLTNNPTEDLHPDWSPDGTKIIFRSGTSDLAIMDCDGNNVRIIPNGGLSYQQNPDWSPDRTKIVFNALLVIPSAVCTTSLFWTSPPTPSAT